MTNSETSGLDEPVSNKSTQLEDQESAAPEKGPGRAGKTKGEIESVVGYSMLSTPVEARARAATPDTALENAYPDIGAASFGGFTARTVHGVDDRRQITTTADYPWRVHASLLITAGDGSRWIGTGWFIGPRVLITAGHVVCIKGSGVPGRDGWVSSIRVFPGRNGTETPFGEVTSTAFHSVRGWVENGNEEYDYGAIVLDEPKGNETGWLSFGRYADDDLKTVVGNIAGYPGDKAPGTQWYAARRIDAVTARKVRYDIDTAGGQSGAAVYRIKQGKRYAIAIHAYGGATTNSGTRINRAVFDNLSKWKADNA
jgi:V8-like Glu-specific endopeptidase